MPSALDLLLSRLRRDLENAEAPLRSQMVLAYESAIAELEHDLFAVTWLIEDALSRGVEISPDWLYRQDRYKRLIDKAEAELARFSNQALPIIEQTNRSGVTLGARHATPLLEAAGIQASFGTTINTAAVDRLYQMMFRRDSPIRDVLDGYGGNATAVIRHHMGQGVIQGLSPREVVRNIMRDLASGTNRARLTTLVRTEHMRSYRLSQAQQLEPYSHAIKGYRWSCALQTRTCLACLAMDGEVFDEPQTKMHPNCRCICTPIGYYTPERYQRQSGAEWLAQQPESVQRGMFPSQAAYEAWKRGDVTLGDFVGEKHSDVWGTSIYQLSGREAMARGRR